MPKEDDGTLIFIQNDSTLTGLCAFLQQKKIPETVGNVSGIAVVGRGIARNETFKKGNKNANS